MRLIDKDALFETLVTGDIRETHQFCYPCKKVLEAIDAQPTVEPQRMSGKWIFYDCQDDKYDEIKCPLCHKCFTVDAYRFCDIGFVADDFKYCPNCGAEMETEQQ